jgi:hypothetical protein
MLFYLTVEIQVAEPWLCLSVDRFYAPQKPIGHLG